MKKIPQEMVIREKKEFFQLLGILLFKKFGFTFLRNPYFSKKIIQNMKLNCPVKDCTPNNISYLKFYDIVTLLSHDYIEGDVLTNFLCYPIRHI